jgi:hypothetical protein
MRTRSYFSIYLLTYLYSFRFWLINYFYWIIPSEFVLHHRCFLLINKVEKNKYNYFLFIKSSSWKKEKVNNDMNWRTRRSMCVCAFIMKRSCSEGRFFVSHSIAPIMLFSRRRRLFFIISMYVCVYVPFFSSLLFHNNRIRHETILYKQ